MNIFFTGKWKISQNGASRLKNVGKSIDQVKAIKARSEGK